MQAEETLAPGEFSTQQEQAYRLYTDAITEHAKLVELGRASPAQLMSAMKRVSDTYADVMAAFGTPVRRIADVERIKQLKGELDNITASARSAYSMIHAADSLGVIELRPQDADEWDHDVCCCLISDAQVVLRKAIERAQEVQ